MLVYLEKSAFRGFLVAPCRLVLTLLPALVCLLSPIRASGFEVTESYSPRLVPLGWSAPAPGYPEGGIVGTFLTSEPAVLLSGGPSFEQVSATTWERLFLWHETQPTLAVFQNLAGTETDTLLAWPTPWPALVPGGHAFPIVSLETDPAGIWSHETGLYVWGAAEPNWDQRGSGWEREAQLDLWDAQGLSLVSRPIGLRINGGWTRCLPQKSWRLYFDHHGTAGHLDHDFFGEGTVRSERLLLRQTMQPAYLIKDHWATAVFRDLGHRTSRWTPAVAYLNGEYWGLYSLRERLDDEWATTTLGYDPDHIILIKDGEIEHGDGAAWPAFLTWVTDWNDTSSHGFFASVSRRLDLEAYTDWILVNAFAASGDNGFAHNLVLLRRPDQRWEYVMWDEDDIFQGGNLEADLLRFYGAATSAEYEMHRPPESTFLGYFHTNQYCRLFRQLMGNAEYRALFRERSEWLLGGVLRIDTAQARLDSLHTLFAPELDLFAQRHPGYGLENTAVAVQEYKDFVAQRHPLFTQQVQEFLADFTAPVELCRFAATAQDPGVRLAWRTEQERENLGFQVWRAVADSTALELLATHQDHQELAGALHSDEPREYAFVDADAPAGQAIWYQLRHEESGGAIVVHDWLEGIGPEAMPAVVLNEFMARNSTTIMDPAGQYDDWVELYNRGAELLNLAGYYLTDDLNQPHKWALPAMDMRGHSHLLIWCDDDPGQEGIHANFKLSGSGEQLGLFRDDAGLALPVDTIDFGPQSDDVSYGRLADGLAQWGFFPEPTPMAPNSPLTPASPVDTGALLSRLRISPNPGSDLFGIRFTSGRSQWVTVDIYDARGLKIRHLLAEEMAAGPREVDWDRRDDGGRRVASGLYLVRVQTDRAVGNGKICVVR